MAWHSKQWLNLIMAIKAIIETIANILPKKEDKN